MKQKLLRILPFVTTALMMLVIFLLSSQTREESSQLSTGLTKRIIDIIMFHSSEADKAQYLEILHHIIRKCAHFVLYALLGLSAGGMFVSPRRKYPGIWLYTVAFSTLYAVSDEFHQSLVAGRGPMLRDVLIDTAGSATGAAVFIALLILYNRKDKNYD